MHFIDIRLEVKKPRERFARHLRYATGYKCTKNTLWLDDQITVLT